MKKHFIFLFFLFFIEPAMPQQQEVLTDKNIPAKIDSLIAAKMQAHRLVGVSIGIVKNGKIYLCKGYGSCETGKEQAVDSLTHFSTCSVTKLFTATAMMQLVEAGKIDLQQKLVYYIPGFKMKDKRYKDITIEHLLTHTSGLYWDMELKHSPNDSSALRKLVYSLHNKILDFAPGTKFDATKTYSNAAFDIMGYLVQKLSGMPYADYIRQNIFDKTGMQHSTFDYKTVPAGKLAAPHILKHGKPVVGGMWTENTEHTPSGNLNSCTADLCRWMIHVLNIEQKDGFNGMIKKSTLDNMWSSRQVAPQNKKVSIGLSWFIRESDEWGKHYWHVGDNPGYCSILTVFPGKNTGIVILCNSMYAEDVVWNEISFEIMNFLTKP